MATCFCGCGETIRFADRGINKQGQRTVELLAKLEFVRERVGELDSLHVLDSLIQQGDDYEVEWTRLRHGGTPGPSGEARRFKKEWEAWGRRGMGLTATLETHSKPTSGRKGYLRVHGLKEDVEKRLGSLPDGEEREVGLNILERLEPLTRLELPENPESGFFQRLMLEADLWLAGTSEGWRFRTT